MTAIKLVRMEALWTAIVVSIVVVAAVLALFLYRKTKKKGITNRLRPFWCKEIGNVLLFGFTHFVCLGMAQF